MTRHPRLSIIFLVALLLFGFAALHSRASDSASDCDYGAKYIEYLEATGDRARWENEWRKTATALDDKPTKCYLDDVKAVQKKMENQRSELLGYAKKCKLIDDSEVTSAISEYQSLLGELDKLESQKATKAEYVPEKGACSKDTTSSVSGMGDIFKNIKTTLKGSITKLQKKVTAQVNFKTEQVKHAGDLFNKGLGKKLREAQDGDLSGAKDISNLSVSQEQKEVDPHDSFETTLTKTRRDANDPFSSGGGSKEAPTPGQVVKSKATEKRRYKNDEEIATLLDKYDTKMRQSSEEAQLILLEKLLALKHEVKGSFKNSTYKDITLDGKTNGLPAIISAIKNLAANQCANK